MKRISFVLSDSYLSSTPTLDPELRRFVHQATVYHCLYISLATTFHPSAFRSSFPTHTLRARALWIFLHRWKRSKSSCILAFCGELRVLPESTENKAPDTAVKPNVDEVKALFSQLGSQNKIGMYARLNTAYRSTIEHYRNDTEPKLTTLLMILNTHLSPTIPALILSETSSCITNYMDGIPLVPVKVVAPAPILFLRYPVPALILHLEVTDLDLIRAIISGIDPQILGPRITPNLPPHLFLPLSLQSPLSLSPLSR